MNLGKALPACVTACIDVYKRQTLGFPWGYGSTYVEQVRKFVQKAADGSFPVADKLIEVMDYYCLLYTSRCV